METPAPEEATKTNDITVETDDAIRGGQNEAGTVENQRTSTVIYSVNDVPQWYLCILLGFQVWKDSVYVDLTYM